MKIVLFLCSLCLFSSVVLAEEPVVIRTNHFTNSKGGDVYVVVQRVENVMGVPYQVLVKGSCKAVKYATLEQAPTLNAKNFCDVRTTSFQLSEDQLSFDYREVDAEKFNQLSRSLGPEELIQLKPTCKTAPKTVSWSLKTYCQK